MSVGPFGPEHPVVVRVVGEETERFSGPWWALAGRFFALLRGAGTGNSLRDAAASGGGVGVPTRCSGCGQTTYWWLDGERWRCGCCDASDGQHKGG